MRLINICSSLVDGSDLFLAATGLEFNKKNKANIIKATIWAYLSMFTKQPPFVRIKAVSKPQTAIGSIQLGSLFLTAFTIFDTG